MNSQKSNPGNRVAQPCPRVTAMVTAIDEQAQFTKVELLVTLGQLIKQGLVKAEVDPVSDGSAVRERIRYGLTEVRP